MRLHRFTAWSSFAVVIELAGLSVPPLTLAAANDAAISANVAGLYVGEEKVVEGKVTAAERDGNVVRLRVGNAPQDLTVSLIIGLLSTFPPQPERYYLGRPIRVTGTIQSFRGVAEMVIHDPVHIQVGDVSTPSLGQPPASSRAERIADPSAYQRLDVLDGRMRALEDRVERLERAGRRTRE